MGCLGAVASLSITCAHMIVCEARDHVITKGYIDDALMVMCVHLSKSTIWG